MAAPRYPAADPRRQVGSPRPKGRGAFSPSHPASLPPLSLSLGADRRQLENKETLCRNVLIYGHCRYEDQGCTFSHDQNKGNVNQDGYVIFPITQPPATTIMRCKVQMLRSHPTNPSVLEPENMSLPKSGLHIVLPEHGSSYLSSLCMVIQTLELRYLLRTRT
ncbi:hypothetical protein B0I35DRAFT_93888 [Stachybotrys elegans]|uniref:C3H1-type domain-containing protein n=1 Tax=Stachybotrys elegans TaxID=80388 RepID=A0A8K0WLR4_9HYPO|nr:hypothetical protein B0I35DRAFT_93888 [Stachybotrys elegans]